MTGIRYLTDEKGRKVAVQIDLKKHGTLWEDFRDGLVSTARRKEKSVPYEQAAHEPRFEFLIFRPENHAPV